MTVVYRYEIYEVTLGNPLDILMADSMLVEKINRRDTP